MKMSWLFNEHRSIKEQLSCAFLAIILVSFGACIAIGLGFTAVLGTSAYSTAEDGIAKQTRTNAATDANELGASIAKDLEVVAKSVCMVAALQASILLKQIQAEAGAYVLPFTSFDSFREFDMVTGCQYPSCPEDFGDLTEQSRLKNMNGSIKHSSVYLYKSVATDGIPAGAVRNDSTWSSVLARNDYMQPIIDSLAYQDAAFDHLYNVGYNTTVFFYLSVQVGDASSEDGYLAVHRGFPGTTRNSTTYDPPNRSWFRHAPVDAFYLDGPYRETFTGRYVVNLSSRKAITGSSNGLVLPQPSVVVAAAVMLLDSLAQIIHTKVYPNEGFGVLVKRDTLEVLVWRNASQDIYNETSGRFLKLSDLEPGLSGVDVRQQGTFTFTDSSGTRWLVASAPCLLHTDHLTSGTAPALVMLVFSQWDTATASLPVLRDNIESTTGRIYFLTGVLAVAVVAVLVMLIGAFVTWLTAPLTKIRHILSQIIAISAEEETKRDYSAIVAVSWFDLHRSDELGYLATSFWYMVVQLHNSNEAKKGRPKYPPNPFHIPPELWLRQSATDRSAPSTTDLTSLFLSPTQGNLVTPEAFLDQLTHLTRSNPPLEVSAVAAIVESAPSSRAAADGDILGQLSAHLGATDEAGDLPDMEMGTAVPTLSTVAPRATYASVGSSEAVAAQQVTPLQLPAHTCKVFTLKVYLYTLSAVLLLGLVAVMGVAVYLLQTEGQGWMLEAGDSIESAEVLNLHAVTQIKSDFVKAYFKQVTVDTQVLATSFTQLLDGNLTTAMLPDTSLRSYALDPSNFYSYPLPNGATKTYNASGYFDVESVNCFSETGCAPYQDSNRTRLTSLLDLQLRPYFHSGNILDFIQTGQEDAGYMRVLPYSYKNYGNPTSCLIEDRTLPFCDAAYLSSPCNPAVTSGPFPAYDARCRSWYRSVAGSGSSTNVSVDEVHFQYPRVSSGGSLVVTAVSPVRHHHSDQEALHGVLNVNVLAATLSASINEFKILRSGYVYLVDAKNVSRVVIHPRLTASCSTLRCCESAFSAAEYDHFFSNVLLPLQRQDSSQATRAVNVESFEKAGESWKFAHSTVSYGTVDYILVAVVPRSEIMKASTDVEDQISDSNLGILIAACVMLSVLICVILYITGELVDGITKPVNDLSNLCEQVVQGNLHGDSIPTQATSSDMRLLLTAFTNTMTALRFGSDSYAKGDIGVAKALFEEALQLFTTTGQAQGIGACHNNLGAVFMSLHNHSEALAHYQKAIALAEDRVASAGSVSAVATTTAAAPPHVPTDVAGDYAKVAPSSTSTTRARPGLKPAQKVLSDRRGNLALLYIAQQRYADAFECLEECMEQDKQSGYIRGCVVKQGNMGHLYLKQGEVRSAERVFRSALTFVTAQHGRFFSESWDAQETMLARQIALFNMAQLHTHCQQRELAVHYLLLSLSQAPMLHLSTSTQTLACLSTLLQDAGPATGSATAGASLLVSQLQAIAQANGLIAQALDGNTASTAAKRVAFALDYSGSMSGGKIQAAVHSLNDLFVHHLAPQDELLILKFSQTCTVELPLTRKEHNEGHVSQVISSLVRPGGGTALYDAIIASMSALGHAVSSASTSSLATTSGKSNDWVVVLTDGQEGCSRATKSTTEAILRTAACGFVMIGVGSDVNAAELEGLVQCAKRGFYVSASGDQDGIRSAFGKVAVLIQGQVIMEDL